MRQQTLCKLSQPSADIVACTMLQVFYTRMDDQHAVPPPASSRYIVKDTGDCSPRCMRATLNAMPATSDLCKTGAMPMAVVISPLALPDPVDDPIQVCSYLWYEPSNTVFGQCNKHDVGMSLVW